MALDQFMVRDVRQYDVNMARWIAQEHARGDSLQQLHDAHPDDVPEPLVVARWRREFPAFDLMMQHAERARAAVLAEETITSADDVSLTAAQANNRIKARQWLASKLDPARFGKGAAGRPAAAPPQDSGTRKHEPNFSQYSDDDLAEIIRAGLKATSIEGQATEAEAGATPPSDQRPGPVQVRGSDTSKPQSSLPGVSVTTNDDVPSEPDF